MSPPSRALCPYPPSAGPSHPPLPSTFFSSPSSPPTPRDLQIINSRLRLTSALHLPSHHRSLCDWLFTSPQCAFHPHVPLPPNIFSRTLSLQVLHHFVDSPTEPQVPLRMPVATHRETKAGLLLLPVGEKEGVMVGYAFGVGSGKAEGNGGRFLYDEKGSGQVLIVMHGVSMVPGSTGSDATMILTVGKGDTGREHVFLMCPNAQYSFQRLPTDVIAMNVAQAISEHGRPQGGTALEHVMEGSFWANEGKKVLARLERVGGEVEMRLRKIAVGMYFGGRGIEGALGKGDSEVEMRREIKRRRNRESAMRSNERRKQMWNALKKELAGLKERVDSLKETEERLRRENAELRLRVQAMGLVETGPDKERVYEGLYEGGGDGGDEGNVWTTHTPFTDAEETLEVLGRHVMCEPTLWAGFEQRMLMLGPGTSIGSAHMEYIGGATDGLA